MRKFTEEILSLITISPKGGGKNYLKKPQLGAELCKTAIKGRDPGLWVLLPLRFHLPPHEQNSKLLQHRD